MKKSFLGLMSLSLLVSGCMTMAPGYHPYTWRGGFRDEHVRDNVYKVTYCGNAFSDAVVVKDYALMRAAEVALDDGFPYFILTGGQSHLEHHSQLGPSGIFLPGTTPTGNLGMTVYNYDKPETTFTFRCFRNFPKDTGLLVFDAEQTFKGLAPKYGIRKKLPKVTPVAVLPADLKKFAEDKPTPRYLLGANLSFLRVLIPGSEPPQYKKRFLVTKVLPGTASAKAGVLDGDQILKVNNRDIDSIKMFYEIVNQSNGIVNILVRRNQKTLTLTAHLPPVIATQVRGVSTKQAASVQLGVTIYSVKVEPNPVPVGAPFAFHLDYMIMDPKAASNPVLVNVDYSILEGEVVKYSKSAKITAPLGERYTAKKKGLVASKKPGDYQLKVTVKYKDRKASYEIPFRIQ